MKDYLQQLTGDRSSCSKEWNWFHESIWLIPKWTTKHKKMFSQQIGKLLSMEQTIKVF